MFIHYSQGKAVPTVVMQWRNGKLQKPEVIYLQTNENRISYVGECRDGMLKIAAARCSSNDHFERKVGRHLATERLTSNTLVYRDLREHCSVGEFCEICETLTERLMNVPEAVNRTFTPEPPIVITQ